MGESDVTELTALPGLEVLDMPHPSGERGPWLERTPVAQAHALRGPFSPGARAPDRGRARARARQGRAEDVRERRDVLPLPRVDPRSRRLHRPVAGDEPERSALGAPDHDRRCEARLGAAHHGCASLVSVLAPGQEVGSSRADHGEARGGDAPGRGRRPCPHHGPARRSDPGVLQDPRRPHDRAADLRAVLQGSRALGRQRRLGFAGCRAGQDGPRASARCSKARSPT